MASRVATLLLTMLAGLGAATSAAAQARWLRAESASFVVYTDVDRATAQRYAAQLETFDQVLRRRHRVKLDEPVRRKLPIYVLRRHSDLRRIAPNLPSTVRGFYTSSQDDTFAAALVEERGNDPTLQHEYVHHFMLQRFPFGYPAWLIEGYAEYFMTFRETPKFLEMGDVNENRASWLSGGEWLPMEMVLKARPAELRRPELSAMFYAQSWALTHWMLSDPERARQLDAYIRAVGEGTDPVKAMKDATGQTPDALGRSLKKYLTRGFPVQRFNARAPETAAPVITELTPAASDLLLLSLRVKGDNGIDAAKDRTDGPVLLNDVRKAAALHSDDPLAELVQARVEVKLGELTRAETLLQRRLAADANNIEALQLLALARLRAAAAVSGSAARKLRAEGGTFAGRAYKLDPDNYQTLIIYARTREGAPNYPTENDVNVLMDALALAPQVHSIRVNAAAALAGRGEKAMAADVLRPLAFNPHGGEAAASARALLAALDGAADAPPSKAAPGATP